MDSSAINELLKCLKEERPAVLFLGQDAWVSTMQNDPILISLLQRLGRNDDIERGWSAALLSDGLNENDMQWLTERFHRHVQSDAMQYLLDVAWSAVFTTSIDPRLARRLETRGRQPEAVLAKDHFARVPRSRFRPPVFHLFGSCSETSQDLKAPQSRFELRQRITVHSNSMINRIAETVTPLGLLVVDGYSTVHDWLQIDDFLAPLSVSQGLRILWFGSSPIDSDFFSELVKKGNILSCPNRLTDVLADLMARGKDEYLGSTVSDEPEIISLENEKFLDPAPSIRLRVEASSSIVDDEWTVNAPLLDAVATVDAFHRFHGDLGGTRSLVRGIARGFAIRRDFEKELYERVEGALRDQGNLGRFVILHGQSGTGKTVAIARLAYDLRKGLKVPVLYASGRIPLATDVDEFCAEAERAGALGTVILCDANQTLNRYRDLSNALRSRGRRITVVGTTYNTEVSQVSGQVQAVNAPSEMTESECSDLKQLVAKFTGSNGKIEGSSIDCNHALALLYRIMASGRERIVAGVSGEARATEDLLRKRSSNMPVTSRIRSALAEQLINAGLHDGKFTLFEENQEGAAFGSDAAGSLIDYVMVAGRVNCPIPVNLLIRTLSLHQKGLDIVQISHLFEDIDLFRWRTADAEGNVLLIGPRLQLEAELICQRRLADKNKELQFLIDLIEAVRPSDVDRLSEVNFLHDLLQKLDRSGPRGDEYSDGYLEIAKALTKLRVEHKVEDASLMLQESAFRRAALWRKDRQGEENNRLSEDARYEVLNEAREVVEIAIREIAEGRLRSGRRTKEYLQVERASIYGYLAVGRARANGTREHVWADYLAARTAISQAMAIADSYFPLDVGLWTSVDILSSTDFPPAQRAEMAADIYAVMDQVDSEQLIQSQQENFQRRRMQVGRVLGDTGLEEEAYQQLLEVNPPVAYFLRARAMAARTLEATTVPLPPDIRREAQVAADFLKDKLVAISSDVRCLNLLLQLEWAAINGDRLLRGERRPIPNDPNALKQLKEIVSSLNRITGEGTRFVYRFLEATLEWITGDSRQAAEIWKSLASDTEYEDSSRIVRRLYISELDGKPKLFRGRIEKKRGESRWSLQVEGRTGNIDLLERDFQNEDLQIGREIRDFAISFNYLGPIADPASRFGGRS